MSIIRLLIFGIRPSTSKLTSSMVIQLPASRSIMRSTYPVMGEPPSSSGFCQDILMCSARTSSGFRFLGRSGTSRTLTKPEAWTEKNGESDHMDTPKTRRKWGRIKSFTCEYCK